jgi:radical SAM superfamily enzyme YgiQ (UPF0313 family)
MDVLLAHGYFLSADREEQRIMRPHPPLGVLYLSSHLKAKGFDVGVFDGTFRRIEDFDECVQRVRPPVVGLAVNMMTKRNVLRMIAVARAAGARVVVGGPDPPHYADEYLAAGADVVAIGEGEQTLEELLPVLGSRQVDRLAEILGLCIREASPAAIQSRSGTSRGRFFPISIGSLARSRCDRSRRLSSGVAPPARVRPRLAHHGQGLSLHLRVVQPIRLWYDASTALSAKRRG